MRNKKDWHAGMRQTEMDKIKGCFNLVLFQVGAHYCS